MTKHAAKPPGVNPQPDPARAWQAVLGREREWDGRLFYGVRSTGIYCKPSCPSRRPRREQVQFFFEASTAESAGFRACRRCSPREARALATPTKAVLRACRYIRRNLDRALSLAELGAHVGMSPFHLQRVFKKEIGLSPKQYIAACRVATFKFELKTNLRSVTDATYEAGYGSGSRVYERAAAELGMTPAAYRKGAPDESIEYGIAGCTFGVLLAARTAVGICSVQLGDSETALEAQLREEFPKAELKRTARPAWLREVLARVEGELPSADIPLDVRVTAFQRRVYQELVRIPRGETRSYSEVAAAMGMPSAARAVASACARNPVAVLIPCHRVVRGSGELSGYRWGIERKRKLLSREGARTG